MENQIFQKKRIFKKLILVFVMFLAVLLFNATNVQATEGDTIKTGTTGSCTYTITELADGKYSVTISGSGAMGTYTSSSYSSAGWYTYRTKIEKVIIEDGVTSIGSYAFYNNFTVLASVEISSSVTSIGNYAFRNCYALTSIDFSNATALTSIGDYAFYNCTALKSVDLSGCTSLVTLNQNAFGSSLVSITVSSSMTNIEQAFNNYNLLTSINAADDNTTYTSIDGVLYSKDLTTLVRYPRGKTDTSFTVPDTVISIGNYAFYYCYNITAVDFSECTALTSIGNYAFYNDYNITEINLSNCTSLTNIGDYTFYYCTALTSMDFEDIISLTSIGNYAFDYCTSLQANDLNNCMELVSIGDGAFRNCYKLTNFNLSSHTRLTSIGNYAFYNDYNITEINLSNCTALTSIGNYTFEYCTSLKTVDLSGCTALEYIGYYDFYSCTSLKTVDLSNCSSLGYIYYDAFDGCCKLTTVNLEGCESLYGVDSYAFYACKNLIEIDLSDCTSLATIGNSAFYYCESLETIILPSSVQTISDYAFYYCSSLKNINLNEASYLISIGRSAFYYCTSLESIELPASIETIGDYAFDYTSLVNIDLSNCTSLTSIGYYAFFTFLDNANYERTLSLPKDTYLYMYTGALYEVCLDDMNWYSSYSGYYYIDSDGIAWYYDTGSYKAYLAYVPSGIESYEVPSSVIINEEEYDVVGINNLALLYANNLEEIDFEDSSNITEADTYAFAYCTTLEKVNGYTTIEEIQSNFANATIENTAVKATQISTLYNLYVGIDLYDYSSDDMEEWIKTIFDIDDLDEITLQLYCNGELAEEQSISLENGTDEYYYTFEGLSIENEYYVDIAHDNVRWGANVLYIYMGNTTPTYAWINIGTKYAYTVSLDVDEANSNGELSSIEIEFVDEDNNVVDTAVLSEENDWTYVFYTSYANNRYYAYIYNSEEYTINLVENENYNYDNIKIDYDRYYNYYSNDTSCWYGHCEYSEYNYAAGATISLAYSEYADVTVHHYLYDADANDPYTEEQVPSKDGSTVADETITGIVGDDYTTSTSSEIAPNYEYVTDSGNTTGKYTSEGIEVIYYYKLKDAEIDSSITKTEVEDTANTGANEADKIESLTYKINYDVSIDEYIGNAEINIIDKLPYEIEDTYTYTITVNGEAVDITAVYNGDDKTLTWTIPKENISTYDENGNNSTTEIAVEIVLTVSYKDMNYMETSITNDVTGTIYLDTTNQTDECDDSCTIGQKYELSIPVQKVWVDSDNINEKRPESVTIELKIKKEAEENAVAGAAVAAISEENTEVAETEADEEDGNTTKNTNIVENIVENIIANTITNTVANAVAENETVIEAITNEVVEESLVEAVEVEEEVEETAAEETVTAEVTAAETVAAVEVEENVTYETAYDYDGNEVEPILLNESNSWSGIFENLPKYDEDGNEIEYVVVETETNEYDLEHYKDAIITYGSEYVEVRNVYRYLVTELEAEVVKTSTEKITSTSDAVDYTINYTATISNYVGQAKLVIVDTLPCEIDESLSDLAGGEYDANTHTITWTVDFGHINTDVDGDYEVSFIKDISIVYGDNLDLSVKTVKNEVEATIYLLDTNEVEISQDEVETKLEIPAKVVVKYVDSATGEEITYTDSTTGEETTYGYEIDGTNGDEYTTEQKTIDGYTFEKVTDNAEGVMDQEEIEVIYYYTQTPAKVVVTYVDADTGEEIADSETIEGYVNDKYIAEQKTIDGYTFTKSSENTEGTMTDETIKVVYYYVKTETKVHVTYIDVETGEEIADDETIEGYVNDEYTTEEKTIAYYTLTETPENAEGTMTDETIEVVYYYLQTSGVVHVTYVDENGNEIATDETIEDLLDVEYSTKSKDIYGYTLSSSTDNTDGTISKDTTEVVYYYTRKTSTVHVTYVDQSTNKEIADDETIEGYVNDTYTTEKKDITYYTYVKSTSNTEGTIEEDTIEVIYYYRASTFNMQIDKKIASITKNGVTTTKNSTLEKVEVGSKEISTTTITVKYTITVTNTGDLDGTATVVDYLPDYFTVSSANPTYWTSGTKGLETEVTLAAGESVQLTVILDWIQGENNFGTTTNIATITDTSNEANFDETSTSDNESSASVVLSIRTGWDTVKEISPMILLAMTAVALVITGVKKKQKTKLNK